MEVLLVLLQNLGKIEATPPVVIILIFFCLLFFFISAVCAGGEQAFSYLDDLDVKRVKAKDNNESKKLAFILERPRALIVTLLISRIVSNVLLIFILNALLDFLVSIELFPTLSITIKIIVIFTLMVLFCETLPRAYARQRKLRMAFFAAPLASSLISIFNSLSSSMIRSSDWLSVHVFKQSNELLTVEDLDEAFAESSDTLEEKEEKNILRGLIGFEDIMVKQVMKSRLDILGVADSSTFQDVLKVVTQGGFTRLPVYSDDMDNIIGVINTKDLVGHLNESDFDWQTIMRKPAFVHEQKQIKHLLKDFQLTHSHFAVVVDEFGGTSGIVTMEDIMEEIIGDIRTEFDQEEANFQKVNDKEFIFDGKTALTEFVRILNLPLGYFNEVKGDSESLGGLVLELSGSFPEVDQQLSCNGMVLIPVDIAELRVSKVKIVLS